MAGLLVSILLATAAGAVVGVRMARLARSTRELPEGLLAVALLGYVAAQLGNLAAAALGAPPEAGGAVALHALVVAGYTAMQGALAVFTVAVFGRRPWRWALAAATATAGALVRLATFLGPEPPPLAAQDPLLAGTGAASVALGFAWMGTEALRYRAKALRACRIGLVSPAVVNRFAVWGSGALTSGLLVLGVGALEATGRGSLVAGPKAHLITLAALVNAATWTLTFLPPAAYLRFVEARAAARAVAG
jgi:hypothetical protein